MQLFTSIHSKSLAHRKEGRKENLPRNALKNSAPDSTRLTHGDPSHYERGQSKCNKKANRLWRIVDNTGRRYLASRRCGYFSNERGIVSGVEGLSWFLSLSFLTSLSFFSPPSSSSLLLLFRLLTLPFARIQINRHAIGNSSILTSWQLFSWARSKVAPPRDY